MDLVSLFTGAPDGLAPAAFSPPKATGTHELTGEGVDMGFLANLFDGENAENIGGKVDPSAGASTVDFARRLENEIPTPKSFLLSLFSKQETHMPPEKMVSKLLNSPFIQKAFSGNIEALMGESFPTKDILKMFGIEEKGDLLGALEARGLGKIATPKDVLKALGIDPHVAVAELTRMKDSLTEPEGLLGYIESFHKGKVKKPEESGEPEVAASNEKPKKPRKTNEADSPLNVINEKHEPTDRLLDKEGKPKAEPVARAEATSKSPAKAPPLEIKGPKDPIKGTKEIKAAKEGLAETTPNLEDPVRRILPKMSQKAFSDPMADIKLSRIPMQNMDELLYDKFVGDHKLPLKDLNEELKLPEILEGEEILPLDTKDVVPNFHVSSAKKPTIEKPIVHAKSLHKEVLLDPQTSEQRKVKKDSPKEVQVATTHQEKFDLQSVGHPSESASFSPTEISNNILEASDHLKAKGGGHAKIELKANDDRISLDIVVLGNEVKLKWDSDKKELHDIFTAEIQSLESALRVHNLELVSVEKHVSQENFSRGAGDFLAFSYNEKQRSQADLYQNTIDTFEKSVREVESLPKDILGKSLHSEKISLIV